MRVHLCKELFDRARSQNTCRSLASQSKPRYKSNSVLSALDFRRSLRSRSTLMSWRAKSLGRLIQTLQEDTSIQMIVSWRSSCLRSVILRRSASSEFTSKPRPVKRQTLGSLTSYLIRSSSRGWIQRQSNYCCNRCGSVRSSVLNTRLLVIPRSSKKAKSTRNRKIGLFAERSNLRERLSRASSNSNTDGRSISSFRIVMKSLIRRYLTSFAFSPSYRVIQRYNLIPADLIGCLDQRHSSPCVQTESARQLWLFLIPALRRR